MASIYDTGSQFSSFGTGIGSTNTPDTQTIQMSKEVYGKITFPRVVDTEFTEFVSPTTSSFEPTIPEFFQFYEDLFYQIPVEGEVNSHTYLVKRSSEYIGETVQNDEINALLEEINTLRQELLDANQTILDLSTNTTS